MSTEQQVLEALQKGVLAAIAASSIPNLSVKMVGRSFSPVADEPWLEVIHMPNNVTDEFWSTGKTYRGIMRLLLHWPMDDQGAYPPINLAESVVGYFAKGLKLADTGNNVSVQIIDNPDMKGVMEMPPEMLIPFSIRYQFFKA